MRNILICFGLLSFFSCKSRTETANDLAAVKSDQQSHNELIIRSSGKIGDIKFDLYGDRFYPASQHGDSNPAPYQTNLISLQTVTQDGTLWDSKKHSRILFYQTENNFKTLDHIRKNKDAVIRTVSLHVLNPRVPVYKDVCKKNTSVTQIDYAIAKVDYVIGETIHSYTFEDKDKAFDLRFRELEKRDSLYKVSRECWNMLKARVVDLYVGKDITE